MSALKNLDWSAVRGHYDERGAVHRKLVDLHKGRKLSTFVDLLLGISRPTGNYSAAEHELGPKILFDNLNVEDRLYSIAQDFLEIRNAHHVPPTIRSARLRYFQIGVGSEASCMMNPEVCWVANVRTIWTHSVIKHADNFHLAAEHLRLYRESDVRSEMGLRPVAGDSLRTRWHDHSNIRRRRGARKERGSNARKGKVPLGRCNRESTIRGLLRLTKISE